MNRLYISIRIAGTHADADIVELLRLASSFARQWLLINLLRFHEIYTGNIAYIKHYCDNRLASSCNQSQVLFPLMAQSITLFVFIQYAKY